MTTVAVEYIDNLKCRAPREEPGATLVTAAPKDNLPLSIPSDLRTIHPSQEDCRNKGQNSE